MSLRSLQRVESDSRELSLLSDRVGEIVNELQQNPFIYGRRVLDIALTGTGTDLVKHGLGKRILGYFVTAKTANFAITDLIKTPGTVDLSIHLPLVSTGATTIDLWVF